MLVIGLTGGIASGKSIVADRFATHHVPIIDTDIIARQLVKPKQPAFKAIIQHFGKAILNEDGELNRRQLRELIFTESAHKRWLEQLLHPLIRQHVEDTTAKLKQQITPSPYCIIVIPLLVETQSYSWLDHILVIDCNEEKQRQRLQMRDDMTNSQCQAILDNQATREQRLTIADSIIENNATLEELYKSIDHQHLYFLKMSH